MGYPGERDGSTPTRHAISPAGEVVLVLSPLVAAISIRILRRASPLSDREHAEAIATVLRPRRGPLVIVHRRHRRSEVGGGQRELPP